MPPKEWLRWRSTFESPTQRGYVIVNRFWGKIGAGEPIWVWQSGRDKAAILAAGVTCGRPFITIPYEGFEVKNPDNLPIAPSPKVVFGEGKSPLKAIRWIPIDAVRVFAEPISKKDLLDSPLGDAIRELTIIRAPMGSLHKVTPEADLAIRSLLKPNEQPWPPLPIPLLVPDP